MDNGWIVVNIGCIECGVSSQLVGVYTTKEEAEAIALRLRTSHNWRQGGQNGFEVFALTPVGETADEYAEAPDA